MKAYRLWQTGQRCAGREQWPLAARAFDDACALTSDAAYGPMGGACPDKAGPAGRCGWCAPGMCDATIRASCCPHAGVLRGWSRPSDEAVDLPAGAGSPACSDLAYHLAGPGAAGRAATPRAVAAFFEALALNITDGKLHFHLGNVAVQGPA